MSYAVALIDESRCIGCTKCIAACPVDAIVGADHLMHTVIAAECIGCELCLPPCPVDCISMAPAIKTYDKALARSRAKARRLRLEREWRALEAARARSKAALSASDAHPLAAALARAKAAAARRDKPP